MDKKTILVVEDQSDYAYVLTYWLETILEDKSFQIVTASDGMEALKMIRSEPPNLIIMDIILPRLDGLQICRMVKFDKKMENIPIILVSSIPGEEIKDKAKKVKADHFFQKPVNIEELIEVARKYL